MAKITGAHSIIYTKDANADREFFKNVLKFSNVDVGEGWLIFGLPPSEVAFHPHDENNMHELYFITEDINSFVENMKEFEVMCTSPIDQGWGILSELTLPGGGRIGIYEPRHPRPDQKVLGKKKKAKKKIATKAKSAVKSKSAKKQSNHSKKAAKKKRK